MSESSASHGVHASGSHYQPSLVIALVIVALFVGAAFLMVRTVTPSTSATVTTTTPAKGKTSTTSPRVVKSRVRVLVANGTEITGLAAHYTQILMTQDWDTLPPVNGPHVKATTIYYNSTYRQAALEIAGTIHVSSSAVAPLGHRTPVTGASSDDVIVLLGPNSGIK